MKESVRTRFTLVFLFLLLLEPLGSKLHRRRLTQSQKHTSRSQFKEKLLKSDSIELEFRPLANGAKPKRSSSTKFVFRNKKKQTNRRLRQLLKKKNILRLAQVIKEQAKKRKLKIKRVLIGKTAKSKLKDRRLESRLSSLLSKKSLKTPMKSLKRKIKKASLKIRKRSAAKKRRKQREKRSLRTTLNQKRSLVSKGGSSSKGKDDEMNFNFMPGFSGMPFPPFMMNGPHFHPPLNMTVNSMPYPNVRTVKPPSVIAETNYKEDQNMMTPILDKIREASKKIESASNNTNINLEAKLQTMLTKM